MEGNDLGAEEVVAGAEGAGDAGGVLAPVLDELLDGPLAGVCVLAFDWIGMGWGGGVTRC